MTDSGDRKLLTVEESVTCKEDDIFEEVLRRVSAKRETIITNQEIIEEMSSDFFPKIIVQHRNISEDEIALLLEKKTWSLLEAVHFILGKKIEIPFSYAKSQVMDYLVGEILNSYTLQYVEIKKNNATPFLSKIDDRITMKYKPWGENIHYSVEEFLEWAVDVLPFPKCIHRKLKIFIPKERLYKNIDENKCYTVGNGDKRGSIKNSERLIKLKACGQLLAWEGLKIEKIEAHPLIKTLIPYGKYLGPKTIRTILIETFPAVKRGRPKKDFKIQPFFYPLNCVLDKATDTIHLNIFKLICMTITETLRSLYPEISVKKIKQHSLISMYLNQGSPILSRMYDKWLAKFQKK